MWTLFLICIDKFMFINRLRGMCSDAMYERGERMETAEIRTPRPPRESSMMIKELRIKSRLLKVTQEIQFEESMAKVGIYG